MSASPSAASNVGIISIAVAIYCLTLSVAQFFMKHEAHKLVIGLSSTSLFVMACSSIFSSFTYFSPRLWTQNDCYCRHFWAAALISYIVSIYLVKAMYVFRIYVISNGTVLGTEQTTLWIKVITASLIASFFVCVVLMVLTTDGECHADPAAYGCLNKFQFLDVYVAFIFIVFDAVLFSAFCYKWHGIMQVFRMSEQDHKIPTEVLQSFLIQFVLTIIAMASCLFDGIAHLLFHEDGTNYGITMVIFLFDCTVVATCNFCMISESQRMIAKLFCFWSVFCSKATANGVPAADRSDSSITRIAKGAQEYPAANAQRKSMATVAAVSRTNSVATECNLADVICEINQVELPDDHPDLQRKVTSFEHDNDREESGRTVPSLRIAPTNSADGVSARSETACE